MLSLDATRAPNNSATGSRTQVARVRAEYPDQIDYSRVVELLRLASKTVCVAPKTYMLLPTHRLSEFQLVAQRSRMVFTASSQAASHHNQWQHSRLVFSASSQAASTTTNGKLVLLLGTL